MRSESHGNLVEPDLDDGIRRQPKPELRLWSFAGEPLRGIAADRAHGLGLVRGMASACDEASCTVPN